MRSTHSSLEPGNYLRTKEIVFRGRHSLRKTLYMLSTCRQIWLNKTTNLQKQGSLRLVLKFHQALAENESVIAYTEFENVID